MVSPVTL
jgi:hypothetical protein